MSIRESIHPHAVIDSKNTASLMLKAIEHQLDDVIENAIIPMLKRSTQVNHALGDDLELLAKLFGLVRFHQEDDEAFRGRISSYVPTLEKITHQGIKNLFYYLSGRDPIIQEQFETIIYRPGDAVPADEHLAKFLCQMPYDLAKVFEVVRVIENEEEEGEGNTVQASRLNFATPHNCDAWLNSDIDHDTSIYDSETGLDIDTGIVPLDQNYPALTKVDLYYEVETKGTWDLALQSTYQHLLDVWKAVGVEAIFQTVKRMTEINFTGDQEDIGITDVFWMPAIGHAEDIPGWTESQRDGTGHFGVAVFDGTESKFDDTRNPRKIWFKEDAA